RFWNRIWSSARAVARRSRMEREMDAELRFHIEAFTEDSVCRGVPREEAMRRARIEFGGIERAKEECREARGVNFIDSLFEDLRFGLRMLGKTPGFTVVATLTLTLGIGANTAVFGVVNSVLLKPLNYPKAEELVALHQDRKSTRLNSSHLVISYAVFCLKKKTRARAADLHEVPVRLRAHLGAADHRGTGGDGAGLRPDPRARQARPARRGRGPASTRARPDHPLAPPRRVRHGELGRGARAATGRIDRAGVTCRHHRPHRGPGGPRARAFFFRGYGPPPDLHSFPTRRSSD